MVGYASLAFAWRPRIAYGGCDCLRSQVGRPRATDRHLVRPGWRHDPAVDAARYPAPPLRRTLPFGGRRTVAGGAVREPRGCRARILSASLHRLPVRFRLAAHAACVAREP